MADTEATIPDEVGDVAALEAWLASGALDGKTSLLVKAASKKVKRSAMFIEAIAASPHLANLTALDLSYNEIREGGAQALAASSHLANVATLNLSRTSIGPIGVFALLMSPQLMGCNLMLGDNVRGRLKHMAPGTRERAAGSANLSGLRFGDAGTAKLASSPMFAALTTLNLRDCDIGNASATELAASPHLSQLTALRLRGNRIGYMGALALALSPRFPELTTLDLDGNPLMEKVRLLTMRRRSSGLKTLDLSENAITDVGAAALAASPHFPCLATLNLSGNPVGPAGLQALRTSEHLRQLTTLIMEGAAN